MNRKLLLLIITVFTLILLSRLFGVVNAGTPYQPITTSPPSIPAIPNRAVGGPATFGYTWIDKNSSGGPNSDTNRWTDVSGTGTASGIGDDEHFTINLTFPFSYHHDFGDPFYVCANGYLAFSDPIVCDAHPHSGSEPDGYVAGWWADLDPSCASSEVYYETVGTAPNRRFIAQFDNVGHFGDCGTTATFQFVLHETSNVIEVLHSGTVGENGDVHYIEMHDPINDEIVSVYAGSVAPGADWGVMFFPPPQNFADNEGWQCSSFAPTQHPDDDTVFYGLNLTGNGLIQDLDVFVQMPHTYVSDWDVSLKHPASGKETELFAGACGGADFENVASLFIDDDGSAINCTMTPEMGMTGRITPTQSLATFAGLPVAGNWEFIVTDSVAADVGSVMQVCLKPTPARCYATPDNGTTVYASIDSSAVQQAIDNLPAWNNTVKIAGICEGATTLFSDLAHINALPDITLQGGYTYSNWTTQSASHETILSAKQQGTVIYANNTNLTLDHLTIRDGLSNGAGAGVFFNSLSSNHSLTIQKSKIINNRATDNSSNGGGIFAVGSAITLTQVLIDDNYAGFSGGGAHLSGKATLDYVEVKDNSTGTSSTNTGGGLNILGTTVISNSYIHDNLADDDGGGLYVNQATTVYSTTFAGNSAHKGGGLYATNPLTISESFFSGNMSTLGGGGLYSFSGQTLIHDTGFMQNQASTGGGVYVEKSAIIAEGSFISNTVSTGGGAVYSGVDALIGTLTIEQTTFTGNQATSSGGAIQANSVQVMGSSFTRNSANTGGGAISVNQLMGITNTLFLENSSSTDGGAIFMPGYKPNDNIIVNALFVRNKATGQGDALWAGHPTGNSSNTVNIHYSTIVGDKSPNGEGVVAEYGKLNIYNTIVTSHTVGISASAQANVNEDFNLFFDNGSNTAGNVTPQSGLTNHDPLFVNPTMLNYKLSDGSPALDDGWDIYYTPTFDFHNNPRPLGWYDLGAFEHVCSSPPPAVIPAMTISRAKVGANYEITYSWTRNANNRRYEGYESQTDPYFTPTPATLRFTVRAISNYVSFSEPSQNLYAVVRGVNCDNVPSGISNRVGKFSFNIVPGTP